MSPLGIGVAIAGGWCVLATITATGWCLVATTLKRLTAPPAATVERLRGLPHYPPPVPVDHWDDAAIRTLFDDIVAGEFS